MDLSKYDNIEVHPCAIVGVNTTNNKVVQLLEQEDQTDPDIAFWTVYGHIPGAGLKWLCDCDEQEIAEGIAELLRVKLK